MALARNTKNTPNTEVQLQLLYGDDSRFKYWETHLFNEVYLRRDLPEKHADRWDNSESVEFHHFLNTLRNLATEYGSREKEMLNWSETETINNWVKHILDALGWKNNCNGVQSPFLEETSFRYDGKTFRTDILIVDHPKDRQYVNQAKGDDKLVEARNSVLMPVEVKYWQRLEEFRQGRGEEKRRTDSEVDDIARTTTPNEQITQYMNVLKKNWGILTDGAKWRLFNTDMSSEDSNRFYEFNLYSLIQSMLTEETEADRREVVEAAKYFYHFFSKETFYSSDDGQESFVGEVLRYSKKYVNKVEEDLKERFVKAMNIACNGLVKSAKAKGHTQDLDIIRNVAESTLFNVLFIKSLESRGILPMSSTDYKKISLSNIIDKIERFDPDKDELLNVRELDRAFRKGNGNSFAYDLKGTELHERILRLIMVIHDGSSNKDSFGFEITGFKESIFSEIEWKIFKDCKLSNSEWTKILFQLGYAESESLNRKYQQIPYSYFTPRQLGSIYESFLEFQLKKSDADMVYEKKQWRNADLASNKYKNTDFPKVKKGELFFTPDNEDRKATGSYYTPDFVVRQMLATSVVPFLRDSKSAQKILEVRVCDPSAGSGHFLVGALNTITKNYLEKLHDESPGDLKTNIDEAKRLVLKNCIFGFDLNPRAVKLTKMSLWLETASLNKTLEPLSDQIIVSDSLDSNSWKSLYKESGFSKFDCIVGNPPYLKITKNTVKPEILQNWNNEFVSLSGGGSKNLYQIFIEMMLKQNPNRFSFIVPEALLTTDSNGKLRELILKKMSLKQLTTFEGMVFDSAVIGSAVFHLENLTNSKPDSVVAIKVDGTGSIVEKNSLAYPAGEVSWITSLDARDTGILSKIESSSENLKDHVSMSKGMVVKDRADVLTSAKKKKSDLPFVLGSSIKDGKLKYEFFADYSKLEIIGGTRDFDKQTRTPRILIRRTGDRLCSVISETSELVESTLYILTSESYDLNVIQAFLSSKLWDYYLKKKLLTNQTGYPQILMGQLDVLPLPKNFSSKVKSKISELMKKKQKLSGSALTKITLEIDRIIFGLFDLTTEEMNSILEFGEEKKELRKSA